MSEIRVCKACGYGRGFHVYFRDAEEGSRIGLICPSCGQSYDLGWFAPDAASTVKDGPVFKS